MSVGNHDHVKAALRDLGVREVFWRVDIRPGRPIWFGVAPSGSLVFGLPGNPVSSLVGFLLFVRRSLALMLGGNMEFSFKAGLDPVARQEGLLSARRTNALRCQLFGDPDGLTLRPTGSQGSHILTSMRSADCLALVPGAWNGRDPVTAELLPGARIRT
jgi:molybdopterin molybdotransferase